MKNDSEVEKTILDKNFGTAKYRSPKIEKLLISGKQKEIRENMKLVKLIQKMKIHVSFDDSDKIKMDLGVWSP